MKIGIITTTFNNFGSRLQNIATVELLKQQYPKSKIRTLVVLENKNFLIRFLTKFYLFRLLCLRLKFRGKVNKNNKLCNYKLYIIKDYSIQTLKMLDKEYDLFVIGSDQIWNNLGEKDNFLFGMFTKNKICNSPSFIPEKCKDVNKMKMYLSSFEHLNVREEHTCSFIKNELGLDCETLPDPTLRLSSATWSKLLNGRKKYAYDCVVYMLHKKNKFNHICEELTYKKAQFLPIFNSNNGNEKYKYSPLQFAKIIQGTTLLITNSFHGAAFASIFNKNLIIYKHNEPSDIRYDVFKNYEKLLKIE